MTDHLDVGSAQQGSPCEAAVGPAKAPTRLSTPRLIDRAMQDQWAGAAWHELSNRVARAVIPVVTRAAANGTLVARCRAFGYGLRSDPRIQQHPAPDEIGIETAAAFVARLREDILLPGAWDPSEGVPFEVFCAAAAFRDAANVYRRWSRYLARVEAPSGQLKDEVTVLFSVPTQDPADACCQRESIREAVASLPLGARHEVLLDALGFGRAELARMTGISRSTLNARLARARRRLAKVPDLAEGLPG